MSTIDPEIRRHWEDFLNPDVLRPRLIAASVYIAAYEALQGSVLDRLRDFFTTGFGQSGDIVDPTYQTNVLARKRSSVYASLDWLLEMHAIDDTDMAAFERVKSFRNRLAHELLTLVGSRGLPPEYDERFAELAALLRKIDVWWIVNVGIATDPDLAGRDIDPDEVIPGSMMSLQLLLEIALGDEQRSRLYNDGFRAPDGGGRSDPGGSEDRQ